MPSSDWEQTEEQRRIKDVGSARSVYNRMQTDNALRFSQIVNVRNQLEGGRPMNPRDMEAQGASWQTNINFGDAQAQRDRVSRPFWRMCNEVPHKVAIKILSSSPKADEWNELAAEGFDEFIEDWGASYHTEFTNFSANYVNYGPGIVHWEVQDSPRWKAVNVQRVVWPKNARMNPEEWECMAFVQDMSASDLYKKVRTKPIEKRNEYLGWNPEAIKTAITYFKDGVYTPDPRDYTRMQDLLVNNDIMVSSPFEPLQLVWLFVKQFDGKIGAYLFTQQGGVDEFLFKDEEYAEDFRHILGAVWYDTGTDSMVHSIKGFGIKNYFFSMLTNRVKSRFIDSATFSFGLNFQRTEDNVPDEAPPVENYGPVTIFPPGMQQLQWYPQVQGSISVIEMLQNNQSENNSIYREAQQQIEQSDTATQAKILAAMQGEMSEASASVFLSQYGENVLSEQVRRLRKRGSSDPDAKEFQRRMKEAGMPEEILYKAKWRVRAGANAGMWNPAVRAMKFQQGMALRNVPGVNFQWFLRNFIANEYGAAAVNQALLPEGQNSNPGQRRQAEMENGDFGQGLMLHAIPEDAHYEHLQVHLAPLQGIAMEFRSTGEISPEKVAALAIGLEHSAEHMQLLSQDDSMKAQFQEMNGPFREIQSVARGIIMRVSQQSNNPNSPNPIAQSAQS